MTTSSPAPRRRSQTLPKEGSDHPARGHRVLLVEDDPDRATLTRHALGNTDLELDVAVATHGASALEEIARQRAHGQLPDLVLLDLNMPGMDGFELLERLRAEDELRHIPVVVLTSSTEDADVTRAYELGANSYLQKPVDYGTFRSVIVETVRYWLEVNEPAPSRSQ